MRLGALLGPISAADQPTALADQARRYEAAGFSSLWSAHAVGRGFMMTDPFIGLTVAAGATEHIELGTAVVQVPLYPPGDLAHRVLSLRQVAGPRLSLGVGAGSTAQDFIAFERDYSRRFESFDRSTDTLRTLLAEGSVAGCDLSPWPAMDRDVSLLFGSWGRGVERAASEFDGWIASARYRSPDEVVAAHDRYRAAGGKRAIVSTIQLAGDTDTAETAELLARFADAGFDDAVVMLLPGAPGPEEVRDLVP